MHPFLAFLVGVGSVLAGEAIGGGRAIPPLPPAAPLPLTPPIPKMNQFSLVIAAKMLAIPLSLITSGYCYLTSNIILPELADESPTISTRIIRSVERRVSMLTMFGVLFPAYLIAVVGGDERKLCWFTSLGLLTASNFVQPLNKPLLEAKGEVGEEVEKHDERALIERWNLHNQIRTRMVFFAGFVGLWASVGPTIGIFRPRR